MAVTKIWAIKDSLSRVVSYAVNPEKTICSDLQKVIHYADDGNKTINGKEKACFVTGVNCNANTAFEEMYAVQEHFNTVTYHNHFVINSVNMWNGKKFDCNKKAYYKFRDLSDKLCEKEQLTVIKNPSGKTPRSMYFAEKRGEPTKYNLMRNAIDYAISISVNQAQFRKALEKQGYIINLDPRLKYATIRLVNDTKNTRLYHLGEQYDRYGIFSRMRENDVWIAGEKYSNYIKNTKPQTIQPKKYILKGSLSKARKITGLKALYLYYCYLLGYIPKKHQPLSPEMKKAWRKIDRYSQEVCLISEYKLNTLDDVDIFINASNEQIKLIEHQRQRIYNKLRRCTDTDKRAELLSQRNDCTSVLKDLRKNICTANHIVEDNPEIQQNIKAEQNIQQQRYTVRNKQKAKYYNYYR